MATIAIEQEMNPWEAQAARFDFAARKLNLEDGLWKVLRCPAREIIVHFPVGMDDGRDRSVYRIPGAALTGARAGEGRDSLLRRT